MPNIFAYAMLFIWPLVMIGLFKKMTPDRALIWSFLGAFMFLPTGVDIDLPLIPTLDKFTIPSLMAMVLCLTMVDQRIRLLPPSFLASIFMIGYVLSPFPTMMTNQAPFIDGVVFMPGLSLKDAVSASLEYAITLIPFVLAFNLLSTRQTRNNFLTAYMFAGLIYSVPILLEVRLAPQLNYWIYGFFPDLFIQQIRFGGFRPVVFMGHGLTVALFVTMTVIATAILWRGPSSRNRLYLAYTTLYLLIVLVLGKTVGSILFVALFLPIIMFASLRLKGWAIMFCSVLVLTYPILRATDAIPTEELVDYAALIQQDRAQSLEFRFENEKLLLDHAAAKPLFGWGFWDRNRLWDPEDGSGLTVTDGYWIIVIGVLGWTGYISVFGLLTLPLLRLWWQRRKPLGIGQHHLTYGIALMLSVNLLELIPNSGITTMTWLLAGMLLASSLPSNETAEEDRAVESDGDESPAITQHTRQARGQRPTTDVPPTRHQRKKRLPGRAKH